MIQSKISDENKYLKREFYLFIKKNKLRKK